MYTLTDDNGFRIDYEAETDRDTLFCPTNHAYFNLAGVGTPTTSIEDHLVRINADFYLPIDMNTNNTGEYPRRSAVCFETQCFPDTPNNPHFPSIVLREGDLYKQTCIYQFSTQP